MNKKDKKIRSFVCICPPRDILDRLGAFMAPVRRIHGYKWVVCEQLHVTLRFLGDTAPERLSLLAEAFAEIGAPPPFDIEIGDAAGFPSPRRPRVLCLGVTQGGDVLTGLAALLEQAAARCGFPAETRIFRPHLTIARARDEGEMPGELADALKRVPKVTWRCEDFVLMQSTLTPSGPIYAPLRRFPLRQAL